MLRGFDGQWKRTAAALAGPCADVGQPARRGPQSVMGWRAFAAAVGVEQVLSGCSRQPLQFPS